MLGYEDVQRLLDDAVGPEEIGAHRAFWRPLTRDQFVVKRVYGYPVVTLGDGENSNLVKALLGNPPFGADTGAEGASMPRMPARMPPIDPENVKLIVAWIDANCPP